MGSTGSCWRCFERGGDFFGRDGQEFFGLTGLGWGRRGGSRCDRPLRDRAAIFSHDCAVRRGAFSGVISGVRRALTCSESEDCADFGATCGGSVAENVWHLFANKHQKACY
jgi:hypothetical protein